MRANRSRAIFQQHVLSKTLKFKMCRFRDSPISMNSQDDVIGSKPSADNAAQGSSEMIGVAFHSGRLWRLTHGLGGISEREDPWWTNPINRVRKIARGGREKKTTKVLWRSWPSYLRQSHLFWVCFIWAWPKNHGACLKLKFRCCVYTVYIYIYLWSKWQASFAFCLLHPPHMPSDSRIAVLHLRQEHPGSTWIANFWSAQHRKGLVSQSHTQIKAVILNTQSPRAAL